MKAARKEEQSPRLTPQGQALLQASRAVTRTIQPTAASMREVYMHSLSFKCVPHQSWISVGIRIPHTSCWHILPPRLHAELYPSPLGQQAP